LYFYADSCFDVCIPRLHSEKAINSVIQENTRSTQEYYGPYKGHDELVWDEEAMFGMKFPGGEIYSHYVILGRHSYEIHGLSYKKFKACIQEKGPWLYP
jgi:uncharacterized CHY-type Zn-finger protein